MATPKKPNSIYGQQVRDLDAQRSAKAELLELKGRLRRGELVPMAEAQQLFLAATTEAMSRIDTRLPGRVNEIEELLRQPRSAARDAAVAAVVKASVEDALRPVRDLADEWDRAYEKPH